MSNKNKYLISFIAIVLAINNLQAANPPLGVNLQVLKDWSRSLMFVDLVKSSRGFRSVQKPWTGDVKTNKEGWPMEDFGLVVFTEQENMSGVYNVIFQGKADLSIISAGATIVRTYFDPKKKSTIITIELSSAAEQLMLSFKNTVKGVRNLKIISDGYSVDNKEIFNKKFLNALKPFNVLRYMDLLQTNNSEISHWNERTKKTDPIQSAKGVAWEYLIELSNTTRKDIWINIPYLADDDYVLRLAKLLKKELRKETVIYLELSNEIWNSIFKAYNQNKIEATKEGKLPGKLLSVLESEGKIHREESHRITKRLYEIITVFEKVFGKDTEHKKIRPVLASQVNHAAILSHQLEFMEKKYGKPKNIIYAIAGAPYFNLGKKAKKMSFIKLEDMLSLLKNEMVNQISKNFIRKEWDGTHYKVNYPSLALHYGVKYVAYEGGPDTAGKNDLVTKEQLHRDPRMGQMLEDYITKWYACGGDLFMYYNLSGKQTVHGSWGLYENLDVSSAKSSAVLKVASTDWESLKKLPCK